MAWYDAFARIYDASLESQYREQRRLAADALELGSASVVLDLPCGTGQSFPFLRERMPVGSSLIGVDLSEGMLRQASRRVRAHAWTGVHLLRADATRLGTEDLSAAVGRPARPDRLHIFLGMTVFPDERQVFGNLWNLLAPGGVCVIVDTWAERPSLQGHLVNWLARADIRRRVWEPLEAVSESFERRALPSTYMHGGTLFLSVGRKPLSE